MHVITKEDKGETQALLVSWLDSGQTTEADSKAFHGKDAEFACGKMSACKNKIHKLQILF